LCERRAACQGGHTGEAAENLLHAIFRLDDGLRQRLPEDRTGCDPKGEGGTASTPIWQRTRRRFSTACWLLSQSDVMNMDVKKSDDTGAKT